MAQLNSLIGSILRDVVRAQHEANLYSLALGEAYGAHGEARGLRIPGVQLGDIELDLQYAVRQSDVPHEETGPDYPALRRFFGELAEQLAHTALTSVAATTSSANTEDPEALGLLLRQEQDLQQGFGAFLGRKIGEKLNGQAAVLVTPEGDIDSDRLVSIVMETAEIHLLRNPDLETLFRGRDDDGHLRAKARENLLTMMNVLAAKRVRDYNFLRTRSYSGQEILITADELRKVSPEAIQSLRLRINPHSYLPAELLTLNAEHTDMP